jgi:phage terminase small subunit
METLQEIVKHVSVLQDLLPRQLRFVIEYVKDWNQAAAAERAGYSGNVTVRSVQGNHLLKQPKIQAALSYLTAHMLMSDQEALLRMASLARADIADFVHITDPKELQTDPSIQGKTHAIKKMIVTTREYKTHTETKLQFELHDSLGALDRILKVYGLYQQTLQTMNIDMDKLTTEQLERLASGESLIEVILGEKYITQEE